MKLWQNTVHSFVITEMKAVVKAKAVPLHATKALGGRGVWLLLVLDLGTRWG
jgi:hypothetical protein